MIKMRSLRTILSVSLAMSLLFGTAVYASEDNIPDISDEQMIEVNETYDEPSVIIPDESDDDAASITDTAGSSDVIVDYTHTDGPVYMMAGESWWYLSFENSRYDDSFQGKRTQKPKYSKSGVLSCSKKKDKDGVTKFHFKGVKPGTTELSFIVTHKGGSYETSKDTFVVFKPFLTKTKFDDITSLNTVINMQDYIDGLEAGYTSSIYMNWDSSKKSVAEVDENGVVRMKGPGTTKITGVYFTDNNGYAKVSATVTVKVPKMSKSSVTLILICSPYGRHRKNPKLPYEEHIYVKKKL